MKKFILNEEIFKNIGKDKLLLMLLAGVVLVICTFYESGEKEEKKEVETGYICEDNEIEYVNSYIKMMERNLCEILEKIEGTGKVDVMISVNRTAVKNILKEKQIEKESKDLSYFYSEDTRTVYTTDEFENQVPYVISEEFPKIEGVVVVADGAGNAIVKEKIINVIKALFSVEINKISVTK